MAERVPTNEKITVLNSIDIYKTKRWWLAAVLAEDMFSGTRKVSLNFYLWQFTEGQWKRKHKLKVNDKKTWEQIKAAGDKLVVNLPA